MATAEQIKSLIRSHLNMNSEQFYASALQIAAHEARQGHDTLANEIKKMVDIARKKPATTNVIAFPQELAGLILTEQPVRPLAPLVVDDVLIGWENKWPIKPEIVMEGGNLAHDGNGFVT